MKKTILISLLAFMSIELNAQEPVLVDGLWYTINSWDGNATVVANPNNEGYSGDIVIPDVVNIGGEERSVTRIGERSFCGTKIFSVTVGKNVTYIFSHAFSYSTVASAVIGAAEGNSCYISDYAFYACDNLKSVVIGDNVRGIYRQVFQNCPSLTSVVLGKNVYFSGASAFLDCNKLKDIYCCGENGPSVWGGRIFEGDKLSSMTLHVPEASVAKYTNYPWSAFGTIEAMASNELVKCATPEISYASGTISFTSATEGAQYISSVEYVEKEFNSNSEFTAPSHFKVKAVAVKDGCLPSDVAEKEFALEGYVDVKTGEYKEGDVNKDGNVNVADHVKLSNIIFEKK